MPQRTYTSPHTVGCQHQLYNQPTRFSCLSLTIKQVAISTAKWTFSTDLITSSSLRTFPTARISIHYSQVHQGSTRKKSIKRNFTELLCHLKHRTINDVTSKFVLGTIFGDVTEQDVISMFCGEFKKLLLKP